MADDVVSIIDSFRALAEPEPHPRQGGITLASTLDPPASEAQVKSAWGSETLPAELIDLWKATGGCRLFVDVEYGQWGLVLLSPEASAKRTAHFRQDVYSESLPGDIVVGEFLGDSDLLVLEREPSGDSGVLIALPIDTRSEWYSPAPTLRDFLVRYRDSLGDKFWEGA